MILDSGKVELMWQDFANRHDLSIDDKEKTLFLGQNKKKTYIATENNVDSLINYKFRFYLFDLINKANSFVISIPIDLKTDLTFKIYNPNQITRLIKKEKLKIKSSISIELGKKLGERFISCSKKFHDLVLEIVKLDASKAVLNNDNEIILNHILVLETHILPENLEDLESLRELIIYTHEYLKEKLL